MTRTSGADLTAEIYASGFTLGPPRHLRVECLMDDLARCADLECETCGQARQRVTPYHRGREYRLVCICRDCGHAIEC